jgi:CRISPR-associated endonuclease/helicase Cas3
MTEIDFPSAFESLTGHAPFRWQRRLFEGHFVKGDVPAALDLPTGLGKTSVMAIWLLARAHGARLPRRLIYVVDRRAVVDQATSEAVKLRDSLDQLPDLKTSLELGNRSLPISTLRGQLADNRAWLEDPSSPAIVIGTVDMIGSRLLFSGYGVSGRMRPVHAALLGTDALIVLDEAHLVPAFQALIEQVAELTTKDREAAPFKIPELCVMTLSATGRSTTGNTFTLEPEDAEKDDVVCMRLNAQKWLDIEMLPASADIATVMADRAWDRGEGGKRVIVFCDRRKVAEAVHSDLSERLRRLPKDKFDAGPTAGKLIELLVGGRRVCEREALAGSHAFRRFSPSTARAEKERAAGHPAYLVATSAGEVGVDIDSDHMVSDLVAWERMVQRLGRVNRLGEFQKGSLIDIFAAPSLEEKDAEAPADDVRVKQLRAPFDSGLWTTREDGRRLASPGALRALQSDERFRPLAIDATTPAPLRPKLTRALMDAWSMTSLDEHPGRPDVVPWIRGWVDEDPQTSVLWRKYLPVRNNDRYEAAMEVVGDFIEAAPPHLTEILETYTSSVVDLMRTRAKVLLSGKGQEPEVLGARDQERSEAPGQTEKQDADETRLAARMFAAVVLTPGRNVERLLRLHEIYDIDAKRLYAMIVGRTVILDARIGGLDETGLLNAKQNATPATIDTPVRLVETAHQLWCEERLRQVGFRVRRTSSNAEPNAEWKVSYQRFVDLQDEDSDDNAAAAVWRVEDWVGDTTARLDPALARTEQRIDEHHQQAECKADEISLGLGLPAAASRLLAKSASVHDLGKMRTNWQAYAGNYGYPQRPKKPHPLAKFTKRGNPNLLKIGDLTYRHEFGSLRDSQTLLADLEGSARDLVLHLVAAHHGNTRPVIAPVDQDAVPSASAELARQAAFRFARLQRQWGSWGLAWWEALLRAADVAASREADRLK